MLTSATGFRPKRASRSDHEAQHPMTGPEALSDGGGLPGRQAGDHTFGEDGTDLADGRSRGAMKFNGGGALIRPPMWRAGQRGGARGPAALGPGRAWC